MPAEVVMPRLGWDMKMGSVAEWLKRDGDRVEVGEAICMIAGDKATTELEALDEGILRIPPQSPEPGQEVPVGTLLAYLLAPGETLTLQSPPPTSASAEPPTAGAEPTAGAGLPTAGAGPPTAGAGDAAGAGRNGTRRVVASPRARRAAAALGVEWRALAGSGRGGRVLERDVQQALAQAEVRPSGPAAAGPSAHAVAAQGARSPAGAEPVEAAVRLQGVRRLTAERMALSARSVAPVTLTTEADATNLVRLREQALAERAAAGASAPGASAAGASGGGMPGASGGGMPGASGGEMPGYTDFIVKLVAAALAEHPAMNAELTDEGIVHHARVNIGLAVDTPRGLFVPVLRDAGTKSLAAIGSESRRLIEAVRSEQVRAEELAGATFTITNLGMFEIDAFTPIVNLPQCAILGIGRIVARPVVVDEASEQVAVRRMLALSLTFDHRLVDGAPAARFLQRIKHFVERPTLWLFR